MVKNYSEWNRPEIVGEPNHYYGISPKKTINISESWDILGNSLLNKLDEHEFTSAYSRDEFMSEAFPAINESADDYTKDKIYALYETQLFYTHREDWFNGNSKTKQIPLILESKNHYVIIHNDKSFAITKESYNILMNNTINEGFFGDLWDGIKDVGSSIGGFFSDAFDAVKDRLGKWADSIGDAAKSVVGFMGTCAQAVTAFTGSDWLAMVQTLSSLFRGVYGTVGNFLFPGASTAVTSIVGGATGLLGLYTGYDRVSKPYSQIKDTITKVKDSKELGTELSKIGPSIISGASNMAVGAKDIISCLSPSEGNPLGGISDVASLFSGDKKDDLKKQGESLFSEGNIQGIAKTLLSMSNVNEGIIPANLEKTLKNNILMMGGIVSLQYVVPDVKDTVLGGAKSISSGLKKVLELPKTIDEFLSTSEGSSEEEGGSAGIIGDALGYIKEPMINGVTSFCDIVKSPVESASSVLSSIPNKFDSVLKSISKNGVDVDVSEVKIEETEKVKPPKKMVKMKKDDVEVIKKNKKKILGLKESKCVDFNTWDKFSS